MNGERYVYQEGSAVPGKGQIEQGTVLCPLKQQSRSAHPGGALTRLTTENQLTIESPAIKSKFVAGYL